MKVIYLFVIVIFFFYNLLCLKKSWDSVDIKDTIDVS